MIELTGGLAGRPPRHSGHDACDAWAAFRKIATAAGLPEKWGMCPLCGGSAQDPSSEKDSDAWEKTEPPVGEGWQLWETTTEGSPKSPVFRTAEKLAAWCAICASTVRRSSSDS
jgi:hypothetical protein